MKTVDYPFIRVQIHSDGRTVIPSVERLVGQWQPATPPKPRPDGRTRRLRRGEMEQVRHPAFSTSRIRNLIGNPSGLTTGVTAEEFDLVETTDLCWLEGGIVHGETFILRTDVPDLERHIDHRFERLSDALAAFARASEAEYAETIAKKRDELEYMEHEATHVAESAKMLDRWRNL